MSLSQKAGSSGGAGGKRHTGFWRSNRGLASALLVLTAGLGALIWFSGWAHEGVRDGFTLGGFPLFAIAAMAVSLAIMLFDTEARNTTEGIADLRWLHVVIAIGTALLMGAVFLIIPYIGFVLAIAALVTGGAAVLLFRPIWVALAVGLGTALFLRVLLFALGVSISDGPFAGLF